MALILVLLILVVGYFALVGPIPEWNWMEVSSFYLVQIIVFAGYFYVTAIIVRDREGTMGDITRFTAVSICYMLVQILLYAILYLVTGLKYDSQLSRIDYVYFSAITWTTVGYGDITPTEGSRLFTALEAICGYIYMGIFIGIFGSFLMSNFSKTKDAKRRH